MFGVKFLAIINKSEAQDCNNIIIRNPSLGTCKSHTKPMSWHFYRPVDGLFWGSSGLHE